MATQRLVPYFLCSRVGELLTAAVADHHRYNSPKDDAFGTSAIWKDLLGLRLPYCAFAAVWAAAKLSGRVWTMVAVVHLIPLALGAILR
jgi:hypothetical protein